MERAGGELFTSVRFWVLLTGVFGVFWGGGDVRMGNFGYHLIF